VFPAHTGRVVVLGGGVAGTNTIFVAVRLGAQVTVFDTDLQRLRELDALYAGRIKTIASSVRAIASLGWRAALLADPALELGMITFTGTAVNASVAQAHELTCSRLEKALR